MSGSEHQAEYRANHDAHSHLLSHIGRRPPVGGCEAHGNLFWVRVPGRGQILKLPCVCRYPRHLALYWELREMTVSQPRNEGADVPVLSTSRPV